MVRTIFILAAFAGAAFGQAGFEAADVHVSPHSNNPGMHMGVVRGRYDIRMATMVDLVRTAYGVDASNVVGGPSWLELNRYDITAKLPPDSKPDAFPLLLQ